MTTRLVGGIAAATFALGILTGAAGTIVARDASAPATDMTSMMGAGMGAGMGAMMSGSMMGATGPGMMDPGSSTSPDASPPLDGGHDSHHPAASPEGTSK